MPGIFVGHAARDQELVDAVVELLRLGADVPVGAIFYASGAGTGVPAGTRFNEHIRAQVEQADLVIALISPAFQESAFALAEVGAAWVIEGNFFPVAVPGFSHRDLEGVLVGVQVPSLDDPDALGELRDRVSDALGLKGNTSRWNKEQAKFLARLDGLVERLEGARKVPFADLERANSERDGAQEALKEVENEWRELEERFEELKKAKTREEALEVALPKEEQARFEALRIAAQARLKKLPRVVRTAISYSLTSEEMPRPSRWDDDIGADEVAGAERDGYLYEGAGDSVLPDTDVMAVADAVAAVQELQCFFDNEVSEEFDEGFKREHGAPPDLARGIVWDALFGRRSV